MTIFKYSEYHIDPANIPYIDAIATYNRLCQMTVPPSPKIWDGAFCEALPELLAASQLKEKITIQCVSGDSNSTYGIFPPVQATPAAASNCWQLAQELVSYIQEIPACHQQDLNIIPPTLRNLTQAAALSLFHEISRMMPLVGGIHLSKAQSIVFQTANADQKHAYNFCLSYGEQSGFSEVHASFDIDEGFHELDEKLLQPLQAYFDVWKANDYRGPVISPEQAGFDREFDQHTEAEIAAACLNTPQMTLTAEWVEFCRTHRRASIATSSLGVEVEEEEGTSPALQPH